MAKEKIPQEFIDTHYEKIKKANPSYSHEVIMATIGKIWYHEAGSKAKSPYNKARKERIKETEKSIQHIVEIPTTEKSIHFIEIDADTRVPEGLEVMEIR